MNQIKHHYISVFISAVCLIRQTSKIIAKNCGNAVPGVGRNRYTLDTLYPIERGYAVNEKQTNNHMLLEYVNDQLRLFDIECREFNSRVGLSATNCTCFLFLQC